jgi:hypothetical protein
MSVHLSGVVGCDLTGDIGDFQLKKHPTSGRNIFTFVNIQIIWDNLFIGSPLSQATT